MSMRKGFSLLELAIALVVIGLIIAAVMKGQDLITNARAKRLASFVRNVEVAQWNYYDRLGFFANSTKQLKEELPQFEDHVDLGKSTFSARIGTADAAKYPVVVVVRTQNNGTSVVNLDDNDADIVRGVDYALDNVSDADTGRMIAINGANYGADYVFNNIFRRSGDRWIGGTHGIAYFFDTKARGN